jgi:hypothetical protein
MWTSKYIWYNNHASTIDSNKYLTVIYLAKGIHAVIKTLLDTFFQVMLVNYGNNYMILRRLPPCSSADACAIATASVLLGGGSGVRPCRSFPVQGWSSKGDGFHWSIGRAAAFFGFEILASSGRAKLGRGGRRCPRWGERLRRRLELAQWGLTVTRIRDR